jgi:hypothetical protein
MNIKFVYLIIFMVLFGLIASDLVRAEDYNRSEHFGSGWIDADGDCQDTRQEVLIAESLIPVNLGLSGCRVMTGVWYCEFTGKFFTDPRKLDIDHMVPLKEAWLSGADKWTYEERLAYANDLNDPGHLIAVALGANRSKGADDPGQWLPPVGKKVYVRSWLKVKMNYGLSMDSTELIAILLEM